MKLFATILSIYIMFFAFMPCEDSHIADNDCYNLTQQDNNEEHDNDFEICSPFCFCNCCHTLTLVTQNNPQLKSAMDYEILPLISFQIKSEAYCSFWHPPKTV
jgi:hypothetical protein